MNKKHTKPIVLTALTILLLAAISCTKQVKDMMSSDTNKLPDEIQWAKDYYTGTLQPNEGNEVKDGSKLTTNSTSAQGSTSNMKTLFWEKSTYGKRSGYQFVEVPLKYTKKITSTIVVKSNGIVTNETANAQVVQASVDRLVIYKNAAGTTYQKIISYVPDLAYLKRHKGDISGNRLDKIDADFDGYEFHKDWAGNIKFILRIVSGKVTHVYNYIPNRPHKTLSTNTQVCETVEVWEWFTDCYYNGDDPVPFYCSDPYPEFRGTEEHCYDDGSIDCGDPAYFGNPECPNDPDPNDPGDDPGTPTDDCGTKTAAANSANSVVNNTTVPNLNSTIDAVRAVGNLQGTSPDGSTRAKEATFNIEKDPNNGAYSATQPSVAIDATGSSASLASPDANTVYIAHGHTLDNPSQPSPFDIWQIGQTNASHSNVLGDLIFGNDADYLISVGDRSTYHDFDMSHPSSEYLGSDGNFDRTKTLGLKYWGIGNDAYHDYLNDHNITNPNPQQMRDAGNYGLDVELAYFSHDAGLVLLKKDPSTGTYKALHIVVTTDANGATKLSVLPCNP